MRISIALCAVLACAGCARASGATCRILEVGRIDVSTLGNRVRAAGRVDGQPVTVLVDTGSALSFVTRTGADRLHLMRVPASGYRVFGVGGPAQADETYVRRLQIGSLVATDVWLLLMSPERGPAPQADVVLGAKLLSKYTTEFDLGHGVIRLLRPEGCEFDELAYWTRTYSLADLAAPDVAGPQILTDVVLNGHRLAAVLDTGVNTSVVTRAAAEQVGVAPWKHGVPPFETSQGMGAERLDTWLGRFDTFTLGDEQIRNVSLRIADLFRSDTDVALGSRVRRPIEGLPSILIGCDFFLSHRLLVLFPERKLLFTYNGGPVFQAIREPAH